MGTMEADLLVHGMAAARAGQRQEAVYYLEWLLRLNPDEDQKLQAYYWLSEVAETREEAVDLLETLLSLDPFDLRARKKLGILTGKIPADASFDPNGIRQPAPQGSQKVEGQRFTCPQCGGRMTYSPDGSSLVCEYCEARQQPGLKEAGATRVKENDFLAAMVTGRGHWRPQAELDLHCSGCGGIFTLPPAQLSKNCPYCDSPHVTREPAAELILPGLVVPFEIGKEQARQSLRLWLEARFRGEWPRIERGTGLYLPAWVFHVVGILPWSCEVRRNRDWVMQTGQQIVDLPDIRLPAASRLAELWGKALAGYNLTDAQPFAEGYLADWPAETYQVELGDASLQARVMARDQMKQHVDLRIMEQHRNLAVNSTDLMVEAFQLVLLPAWLAHFTDPEGQRVDLLINGQTGQVLSS